MSDVVLPSAGAPRLPGAIVDAAIGWAVKLTYGTPTPAMRQAFDAWLKADPRHGEAWSRVAALRSDLGRVPPRLARETLRAAEAGRLDRRSGRRAALKTLALLGLAGGTGWLAQRALPWQRLFADASTAIGEQKTLRLDDGSVIVLNTDSAVSTDLDADRRLVALRRGEILVTTGPDADRPTRRPFWVSTPYGSLRAIGTRFVVRLYDRRARISVQDGAVDLHPEGGKVVRVAAGESRWLGPDGTPEASALGFANDGWADGVISGDDIRLADLLAELERYRSGRILCDERVAELRLSGVFQVSDTDQALRFLAQTQPITVTTHGWLWTRVGPRD